MISAADLARLQELGVNVNTERVHHLVNSGYHYDFDDKRWYHPDKHYSNDAGKSTEDIEAEVKAGSKPPATIVGSMRTLVLDPEAYKPAFHDNQQIREHPRSDEPVVSRSAELQKKFSSRYANEWDRQAQKLEMVRRYNMGENLEGWVVRRKPGANGGNSIDDYEVWSPDEVLQMRNHKRQQAERVVARQQRQQQQQAREFGESARMAEFTKMLKGMPREQFLEIMQQFGFAPTQQGGASDV